MNSGSFKDKRRSILRISAPPAVLAALLLLFAGGIAGGVVEHRSKGGSDEANGKEVGQIGPEGKVLEVKLEGSGSGTVLSEPAGIECPSDCAEAFRDGEAVTLTAESATDSIFSGFSGDCEGAGPCELDLRAPKHVKADFATASALAVAISGNGTVSGGSEDAPSAISCNNERNEVGEDEDGLPHAGGGCQAHFPKGTPVTLILKADEGWSLESPTGCDSFEGATCIVTMYASRTVDVVFASTSPG